MPYLIEVAISILSGVIAGLSLMASTPETPLRSALIAGTVTTLTSLLQALRALKQTPPSEHKQDA